MASENMTAAADLPAVPAMDRILAENQTDITRELFQEAFLLTFNKKPQHQILGIGAVCAVLGAVLLLFQLYSGKFNIFWVPFLCMGIFVLIWGFRLPKKKERTRYRAVSTSGRERKILFYENRMEILIPGKESEDAAVRRVEKKYSEIDSISETDNVLLFVMKDKSGVIAAKNGFRTGDAESVKKIVCNRIP